MDNKRKSQPAPFSLTDRIPHGVRKPADGIGELGDIQLFSRHTPPDSSADLASVVHRLEACAAVLHQSAQEKAPVLSTRVAVLFHSCGTVPHRPAPAAVLQIAVCSRRPEHSHLSACAAVSGNAACAVSMYRDIQSLQFPPIGGRGCANIYSSGKSAIHKKGETQ